MLNTSHVGSQRRSLHDAPLLSATLGSTQVKPGEPPFVNGRMNNGAYRVLLTTRELMEQLSRMQKRAMESKDKEVLDTTEMMRLANHPVCIPGKSQSNDNASYGADDCTKPYVGLTRMASWPIVQCKDIGVEFQPLRCRQADNLYLQSFEIDLLYNKQASRYQVYSCGRDWTTYLENWAALLRMEKQRQYNMYNSMAVEQRPPRQNNLGVATKDDLTEWLDTPAIARVSIICYQA